MVSLKSGNRLRWGGTILLGGSTNMKTSQVIIVMELLVLLVIAPGQFFCEFK